MATLTNAEIDTLIKNELVINAAADVPIGDAEILAAKNDAYASVWEIGGPSVKNVASATAWTTAQSSTTGVVVGILADIGEILSLWASTTSGSVGVSSGDNRLDHLELDEIQFLRKSSIGMTYDRPKAFAATPLATATAADVHKLRLDYWPTVTGFYFPLEYSTQFVPLGATTTDKPDVNDLESYDIGYLAALYLAPRVDRYDLMPLIASKVSNGTQKALERKMRTLLAAGQERV